MDIKQLTEQISEYMSSEGNTSIYDNEEGYDVKFHISDLDYLKELLHGFEVTNLEVYDSYTGYKIPSKMLKF